MQGRIDRAGSSGVGSIGSNAGWVVEQPVGPSPMLFEWEPEPVALVRIPEVIGAALVLGSTQPLDARGHGFDVVRRRSGGTAVWLDHDVVWVDVVVPRGHPRWDDDALRAFHWLGDVWSRAVSSGGAVAASVHRERLRHGPWSHVACFGGVGPGEVLVKGRKLVGLAQRRTRRYAWFQCAALLRWDPGPLVRALDLGEAALSDLRQAAAGWPTVSGAPMSRGAVAERFLDALHAADGAGDRPTVN